MSNGQPAPESPRSSAARELACSILVAIAVSLPAVGCGTMGDSSSKPSASLWPLGAQAKHEALRKAVEADSFPTAQQAGI